MSPDDLQYHNEEIAQRRKIRFTRWKRHLTVSPTPNQQVSPTSLISSSPSSGNNRTWKLHFISTSKRTTNAHMWPQAWLELMSRSGHPRFQLSKARADAA